MAKKIRYDRRGRNEVILALEAMIAHLTKILKITDEVATEVDTIESVRELDKDLERESTEEDQIRFLNESRDRSTSELGHIQRRIADVKRLKAAFESDTQPPQEDIEKTYRALMDSVAFVAIGMSGLTRNPNIATWSKVRLEEYEDEKKRLYLFSHALTIGFGIWPKMSWHLFPFDKP